MVYQIGDMVVLENKKMGSTGELFTIHGLNYDNNLYYPKNWYIIKHLCPPHPFGAVNSFVAAEERNLWKLPKDAIIELIILIRLPMDIWRNILTYLLKNPDISHFLSFYHE